MSMIEISPCGCLYAPLPKLMITSCLFRKFGILFSSNSEICIGCDLRRHRPANYRNYDFVRVSRLDVIFPPQEAELVHRPAYGRIADEAIIGMKSPKRVIPAREFTRGQSTPRSFPDQSSPRSFPDQSNPGSLEVTERKPFAKCDPIC